MRIKLYNVILTYFIKKIVLGRVLVDEVQTVNGREKSDLRW